MRKKAERQLPLDFTGTQKLTKEWYSLYRNLHEILEANPAVLDVVHADLTKGEKKLKRNVEGVASESILRLAIVQQIEGLSFRAVIVRRVLLMTACRSTAGSSRPRGFLRCTYTPSP
jgi:predicted nuclease with RNAse H fold